MEKEREKHRQREREREREREKELRRSMVHDNDIALVLIFFISLGSA